MTTRQKLTVFPLIYYLIFAIQVSLWVVWLSALMGRDSALLFATTACQYCLRLEAAKARA